MNTIDHFKKLYAIAKEQGIGAALKYDARETAKRHLGLAIGLPIYIETLLGKPRDVPFDEGSAEAVLGPDGEIFMTRTREAYSDIKRIGERQPDGRWVTYCEFPVQNPDGSWRIEKRQHGETMKCPNCHKFKFGELQAVCKNCGYTDGSDRWFSNEDEISPIVLIRDG